jgi:hypothetical protein
VRKIKDVRCKKTVCPNIVGFWGLFLTAPSYVTCMCSIIFVGPIPQLESYRQSSVWIRGLVFAVVFCLGIPKIIVALRDYSKLRSALREGQVDNGKWARKTFMYITGFEVICLLGFLSFLSGSSFGLSIAVLVFGTLCKLMYVPAFLMFRKKAIVSNVTAQQTDVL